MPQNVSAEKSIINYQPIDNSSEKIGYTTTNRKVANQKPKAALATVKDFFLGLYNRLKSLAGYITNVVTDTIKNRIILANIFSILILPSQFLHNHKKSQDIIEKICSENNFEKININSGGYQMKAIICYPPNWDKSDKSKCSLINNPNGIHTSHLASEKNDIHNLTKELLKQGPVILYDYPNTGINHDIKKGITGRIPLLRNTTENKILDCAEEVMKYAAENFDKVNVVGISLGGAVGTIALKRYLSKNKDIDYSRFQLANIDSFTTLPHVVLTNRFKIADILGWLLGVGMDAESAMKYLISHDIKTLVFNHPNDRVIPKRARMHQVTENCSKNNVTSVIGSEYYDHCDIDKHLIETLNKFSNSGEPPSSKV